MFDLTKLNDVICKKMMLFDLAKLNVLVELK